jgi:hypothetical protein
MIAIEIFHPDRDKKEIKCDRFLLKLANFFWLENIPVKHTIHLRPGGYGMR